MDQLMSPFDHENEKESKKNESQESSTSPRETKSWEK